MFSSYYGWTGLRNIQAYSQKRRQYTSVDRETRREQEEEEEERRGGGEMERRGKRRTKEGEKGAMLTVNTSERGIR